MQVNKMVLISFFGTVRKKSGKLATTSQRPNFETSQRPNVATS